MLERMGVINRRVTVGYDGVPPSLERREDHEDAGGSVALIFIIDTPRLAFPHCNGRACLLQQLLRGFVETDHRPRGIMRTLINVEHVLHRRDEAGVGLRGNHPLLLAMGFENVFLRHDRSCCRSPSRRFRARRLSFPAAATSSAHSLSAASSRTRLSAWLPSRRQKSAARRDACAACASRPRRSRSSTSCLRTR